MVCALLCAAACAETVSFMLHWDVEAFTKVSYSKNGVKSDFSQGANPPCQLVANVGDKISFTADLNPGWYKTYAVEDPVSGEKSKNEITMANAYSGTTFKIVPDELKTSQELGLYVNTNQIPPNLPSYMGEEILKGSDRGFRRQEFDTPESMEPVKAWAEKTTKSSSGTVIKKSYSLSELQDLVKKNPERTYNSFLLGTRPELTVDPTLTISDIQIVSNKMKVVVSAHLNEVVNNSVDLKGINGSLYILTGKTLEELEEQKNPDGRGFGAHIKLWHKEGLKRLFLLTYEEANLGEQEARDHFGANRTYTFAGGKAYVTLDMTNVVNFIQITLDRKLTD